MPRSYAGINALALLMSERHPGAIKCVLLLPPSWVPPAAPVPRQKPKQWTLQGLCSVRLHTRLRGVVAGGGLVAFVTIGGQSLSGNKEARAASKYLNPPKHH